MVKKRNLAIGGVILAGISYAAGILTAPKSGRETRKDLRRAALKAKTEAERKLKSAHSDLSDLLEKANQQIGRSKDKVSGEFKSAVDQAEKIRQKTREILSAIHEGEADDKDLQKAVDDVKKAVAHLKNYIGKTA